MEADIPHALSLGCCWGNGAHGPLSFRVTSPCPRGADCPFGPCSLGCYPESGGSTPPPRRLNKRCWALGWEEGWTQTPVWGPGCQPDTSPDVAGGGSAPHLALPRHPDRQHPGWRGRGHLLPEVTRPRGLPHDKRRVAQLCPRRPRWPGTPLTRPSPPGPTSPGDGPVGAEAGECALASSAVPRKPMRSPSPGPHPAGPPRAPHPQARKVPSHGPRPRPCPAAVQPLCGADNVCAERAGDGPRTVSWGRVLGGWGHGFWAPGPRLGARVCERQHLAGVL